MEEAGGIIDNCKDEEYDSMSNLEGTSLEYTDRYERMEESCGYLDDAYDDITSAQEKLLEAIG